MDTAVTREVDRHVLKIFSLLTLNSNTRIRVCALAKTLTLTRTNTDANSTSLGNSIPLNPVVFVQATQILMDAVIAGEVEGVREQLAASGVDLLWSNTTEGRGSVRMYVQGTQVFRSQRCLWVGR